MQHPSPSQWRLKAFGKTEIVAERDPRRDSAVCVCVCVGVCGRGSETRPPPPLLNNHLPLLLSQYPPKLTTNYGGWGGLTLVVAVLGQTIMDHLLAH